LKKALKYFLRLEQLGELKARLTALVNEKIDSKTGEVPKLSDALLIGAVDVTYNSSVGLQTGGVAFLDS